jgi:hypothetical protein
MGDKGSCSTQENTKLDTKKERKEKNRTELKPIETIRAFRERKRNRREKGSSPTARMYGESGWLSKPCICFTVSFIVKNL